MESRAGAGPGPDRHLPAQRTGGPRYRRRADAGRCRSPSGAVPFPLSPPSSARTAPAAACGRPPCATQGFAVRRRGHHRRRRQLRRRLRLCDTSTAGRLPKPWRWPALAVRSRRAAAGGTDAQPTPGGEALIHHRDNHGTSGDRFARPTVRLHLVKDPACNHSTSCRRISTADRARKSPCSPPAPIPPPCSKRPSSSPPATIRPCSSPPRSTRSISTAATPAGRPPPSVARCSATPANTHARPRSIPASTTAGPGSRTSTRPTASPSTRP